MEGMLQLLGWGVDLRSERDLLDIVHNAFVEALADAVDLRKLSLVPIALNVLRRESGIQRLKICIPMAPKNRCGGSCETRYY
jgi:hypothetical protein